MDESDNRKTMSRRRLLKVAGVGAVGGLAGCTSLPFNSGPSELEQQFETIRESVSQYEDDPSAAVEDGFVPFGPYVPGMGIHFQNQQRIQETVQNGFDIENPPLLVYDKEGTLGGVEYGAPASQVEGTPDLFADENADANAVWEVHQAATHVFSNGNGEADNPDNIPPEQMMENGNWAEFRPVDQNLEAGDTLESAWGTSPLENRENVEQEERVVDMVVNHPNLISLHVWTHVENPDGRFAPVNPEFSQNV